MTEYPARIELRPMHQEGDPFDGCDVCRIPGRIPSQWVTVWVGWTMVAKLQACPPCLAKLAGADRMTPVPGRIVHSCDLCHRREAESTIDLGGRLVSVCGTCRERGEEAAS